MDTIEYQKRRMKLKKTHAVKTEEKTDARKYVDNLISRLLIALILFFGLVIVTNASIKVHRFVEDVVLKENIAFTQIANIYDKYFGSIVPFEDIVKDDATVFNETLSYETITNYKDGYELLVQENYLIPIINSGIIVFIGEKEELGNTVIIQGIDEVDYWYSNVTNLSGSLYDYVSKGEYLGTTQGDKLYLTFKKGSEYLEYDEVIE